MAKYVNFKDRSAQAERIKESTLSYATQYLNKQLK